MCAGRFRFFLPTFSWSIGWFHSLQLTLFRAGLDYARPARLPIPSPAREMRCRDNSGVSLLSECGREPSRFAPPRSTLLFLPPFVFKGAKISSSLVYRPRFFCFYFLGGHLQYQLPKVLNKYFVFHGNIRPSLQFALQKKNIRINSHFSCDEEPPSVGNLTLPLLGLTIQAWRESSFNISKMRSIQTWNSQQVTLTE